MSGRGGTCVVVRKSHTSCIRSKYANWVRVTPRLNKTLQTRLLHRRFVVCMHLCMRKHFALICSNFYDICCEKRPGREARLVSLFLCGAVCCSLFVFFPLFHHHTHVCRFLLKNRFSFFVYRSAATKCIIRPPTNACGIGNLCEAFLVPLI